MKENLKPYAYKQRERTKVSDRVLFVERSGELLCLARLMTKKVRSRSESEFEKGEIVKCSRPETE